MAVEIPVVVDIEGAFKEATKNLQSAMKPLEENILNNPFEIIVELGKGKTEVIDGIDAMSMGMDDLRKSIKSAERQLDELFAKSGKVDLGGEEEKNLATAIALMRQILDYRKEITKEIQNSITEEQRLAQAEMEHPAQLTMAANSIDQLNAKNAAWRQELNSAEFDTKNFEQAAWMAEQLSQELQRVNNQIRILGSSAGSLNELNARLQEITRQYNALSGPQRAGVAGKMLADEYRAVSAEIEKSGKSLQQMISEEQRLAQIKEKTINKRKYENTVLNTTVKSLHVLQEQERILSERLSKASIGSDKYKDLKKQLQDVRAELQKVNQEINGTANKVSNLDVLLGKTGNKMAGLVKRSAELVALHSASKFIRNVREVTAEFEMQRVALGGIIQDTAQAESLFKQLKAAAIKSPFEIKDLVTYTKQLSAYRIETDKLFDVTMRLADVSAGLGVNMNRIILAYGQVRAASVLRGQELRQFTEAGIPLVELLAEKFTQLNGRMVSTAEVFDLISKRAVSFSMVEEIFNDMTDAGGIFYKMQEKQSETLQGQWQKLKDAVSIMYDEIGNTSAVHKAMESMMESSMRLMQNWRLISGAVKFLGLNFAGLKVMSMFLPSLARNVNLVKKAEDAMARSIAAAEMAARTGSSTFQNMSNKMLRVSVTLEKAANTTNILAQAWYRLKAAMMGGAWIGIVIAALTAIAGWIITARKEAQRLNKEIGENIGKGATQIAQAERNFKRLANAAVEAADGSYEQRKALEELKRTYGDVIPYQDLQIDKLREMAGDYKTLTDAIRQKIEMQVHEQNLNQISESYGSTLGLAQKQIEKILRSEGKYSAGEAALIMDEINKAVNDGLITSKSTIQERMAEISRIIKETVGEPAADYLVSRVVNAANAFSTEGYLERFIKNTERFNESMREEEERFDVLKNKMGAYGKMVKALAEDMKKVPEGFSESQKNTFEYNEAAWKQNVGKMKETLKAMFAETNADISDALAIDDIIDFSEITKSISYFDNSGELKNAVKKIQDQYLSMAPQEETTRLVTQAARGFVDEVGISMTIGQRYLKKDGQSMAEYAKDVQDFVEAQKKKIQELNFAQKNFVAGVSNYIRPSDEEIARENQELSFLEKMLEFVKEFLNVKSGGYQQDPLILIYKNRMKFMQEFRDGVEDLNKYLSGEQSVAKERSIMEGRGKSLKIDVSELNGTRDEMMKWYDETEKEIMQKIADLGGKSWSGIGVQAILAKNTKDETIKAWQDLLQEVFKAHTDFDLSQVKKDLEDSIKKLSDEMKRSETARNFFNNILDLTGDEQLAGTLTMSVYGEEGKDFKKRIQAQLDEAFDTFDVSDFALWDKMREAIGNQDWSFILANLDKFPKAWQDELKKMAESAESEKANVIKSFTDIVMSYDEIAQKRVNVQNEAAKKIKTIEEGLSSFIKAKEKDMEKAQSDEDKARIQSEIDAMRKRASDAKSSVQADESLQLLKLSDNYIRFFDSIHTLTKAEAETLRREYRKALFEAFQNGAISANGLRRELNAIDEQFEKLITDMGYFGSYTKDGFDGIINRTKMLADELNAVAASIAKMDSPDKISDGQKSFLDNILKRFGTEKTGKSFAELMSKSNGDTAAIAKNLQGAAEGMQGMAQGGDSTLKIVDSIIKAVKSTITGISGIRDQLNEMRSESNQLEGWGWGAFEYLENFSKYAFQGWEQLKSGDIVGAAVSVVQSIISIFGTFNKQKVERINKNIEEQGKLIDRLDYQYKRLEKAMESAFGSDYISNYNKQLDTLAAKQEAYLKQAELEESKGKNADPDKVKEYQNAARDVADEIADMQSQLAEFFAGTDLASAAKDFASAWIDAYKEFGSVTDAMSEKFSEMIQNMIENSLAAKVMQTMLDPIFDEIDKLAKEGGELSAADIATISKMATEQIPQINDAMTTLMNSLAAAGYNVRDKAGSFTGIARNIANASEESINGLAAGVNTQNFYLSYVPQIYTGLMEILAIMGGGTQATQAAGATLSANNELMMAYLSSLPDIRNDLTELLRAFKSVISPNSASTNTYYVAVRA